MREEILKICESVDVQVDFKSTALIDNNEIDSVSLIEIVSEIMDQFDIEIPFEEVVPENFNSVDAMVRLVEKYVQFYCSFNL